MKKLQLGLMASASALLLAACGGGESEPAATEETTTEEVAPAEEAAVEEPSAPAADDVATLDGTTLADFTGEAAAGEKTFMQCASCHVVEPGVNRVGPSLAGIVGRAAGSIDGYNYTEANANSGITWTPEKMFQYLEDPRRVIPGTKMAFAGLKDGQDRANVIAYLQTTGS
ncbi:cytochrome c family protein [Altererythrobacter rubellus]|uniref:Cytochrome c family protein n=2 Tax=Altererythrobacter rubellus TaxID=2173831 RepID=A0A9Y2BBT8_9SPHN|nr:cytochrome c family protein [Altererythrobacter rubellus]WIW96650.1 cytochrome c family protein [Altererythrobacter rubellus]